MLTSHETTSSAFTWATYLLATHPDIQSNLRTELRTAIPSATNPETDLATLLESLPLLNAVCNETIRLYPTVPITVRNAIRPTTILNQPIPAGTQVLLVPWAINRSRQHWGPDAGLFKPERWIDSATGRPNNTGGATSNYASLTFLHGPRSCIGRDFAKAEMRCLVAAFVGKFEMEVAEGAGEAVPHGVITTKPRDGMELRLKVVES
jgi:cytochrome P450